MRGDFIFNSESVTAGHPDKLCDQVSDAILGTFLLTDSSARVLAECCVSTGIIFIAVKFQSSLSQDVAHIARECMRQAGYYGKNFDPNRCTVLTSITEIPAESLPPIDESTLADDEIDQIAARDQVTAFGFACNHTQALMPLPIYLSHRLARGLSDACTKGILPYLNPDGKAQVGVEFRKGRPWRIHGITVLASQKEADRPNLQKLRDDIIQAVIEPVFLSEGIRPDGRTRFLINPHGPMIEGGPGRHSGLTGRKTGMDTYGEFARHSGAALSGKDPSRIERASAYAARYAAKNVVAAGLAEQCEVQLSYAIGQAAPVSIQVETFGTSRIPEAEIATRLTRVFEFRPAGIVREFRLRQQPRLRGVDFFKRLSAYGHVGRVDLELPWENLDKVEELKA